MMNVRSKKAMVGLFAAALVIGGSFSVSGFGKVYADEADVAVTQSQNAIQTSTAPLQLGLNTLIDSSAFYLDLDVADVKDALSKGGTLLQVANKTGWNAQVFINTLVSNSSQVVDVALNSGDITTDQAAKLKIDLVKKISEAVNKPGYQDQQTIITTVSTSTVPQEKVVNVDLALNYIVQNSAFYMDTDVQVVKEALAKGNTLAQVAKNSGLDRADLLNYLIENSKQNIAIALQSGDITQAKADELTAFVTVSIKKIVDTSGYKETSGA